ncbi:hypothetical protein [Nocardia sp. NPDC051463]|uniref:hypothetical protein n=1 Tax=Nocardia sp. NPDC051463 TaxID=3154845 RepID=UPI00344B0DDD
MYTEFFFRAPLRKDAPAELIDWFDDLANNPDGEAVPYDGHAFFKCERWESALYGGGAVYQISQALRFTRGTDRGYEPPQVIVHSSLKNYGGEIDAFVDWIVPFVAGYPGDFLGYALYEDARNDYDDQDEPRLIFIPKAEVWA